MCECYVIDAIVEGNGANEWEVMEWHILTHSLIGNCRWVWCDNGEDYEMRMSYLERIDGESCVKERGEERYCWRAGVMSRNEGGEEETLLVWTVVLCLKAYFLSRVTVVREGMSVCEDRVQRNTLQSDGTRILECVTAQESMYECNEYSECCELRQVYSSLHFLITTSHD